MSVNGSFKRALTPLKDAVVDVGDARLGTGIAVATLVGAAVGAVTTVAVEPGGTRLGAGIAVATLVGAAVGADTTIAVELGDAVGAGAQAPDNISRTTTKKDMIVECDT